ncbi:phosphatidylinositol phosphatase PTPRQ-like [Bacillus rossius redtenbacheri]|uniref:phosphatidylinositol phosphatase PTPRQ-like n=1 Tax=Bacillus rossius redtenbacheri TaxID=93214 RepID=UPI002FDE7493
MLRGLIACALVASLAHCATATNSSPASVEPATTGTDPDTTSESYPSSATTLAHRTTVTTSSPTSVEPKTTGTDPDTTSESYPSSATTLAHRATATTSSPTSVEPKTTGTDPDTTSESYPSSATTLAHRATATTSSPMSVEPKTTGTDPDTTSESYPSSATTLAPDVETTTEACGVPGNVTDLQVSASSSSLLVNWTSPSENTACVEQYSVCWGSDECNSTKDTHWMIDNLSACTEYSISVTAVGAAGNSTVSILSDTLAAVPGNVTDLQVSASSSSLLVNWTSPSENTACVQQYSVCWGSDECNSTKDTHWMIDNLSACTEYGISVTAVGAAGNSTVSFPNYTLAAVPGNVTDLQVNASSSSLHVIWTAPSENTACVEQYWVCWGSDECNSTKDTEYTIIGLSACTEYSVSVTAVGAAGNSTTAKHGRTLAAVPGNVTDLQVNASSSCLLVNWTSPSENTACVEQYSVCWGSDECNSTKDTHWMIDNLSACTELNISVTAYGAAGNSTSSVQGSTDVAVPGNVTDLQVTASSSSLLVNWTSPSENTACVQQYSVCWGSDECNSTSDTHWMIDNLSACTEYSISVTAVGAAGNSTVSVLSDTLTAVPGTVKNLQVNASYSSLLVNWTAPSENTACVEQYSVCWGSDECNSTKDTHWMIDNLSACTSYSISVTAVGAAGNSTISVLSGTLAAVPGTVKNLKATASSSSVHLNWNSPSENTACVQQYSVCWGSDECNSTKGTHWMIDNLSACTEYSISVTAVGAAGNSTVSILSDTLTAVPGPVWNLGVRPDHTSLEVFWRRPSVNAACARNYTVCWRAGADGRGERSCSVTDTEHLSVGHLLPCTLYQVAVAAVGPSHSSGNETVHAETLPLVPDGIPGVATVASDASRLQLVWGAPTLNPTCALRYKVCWRDVAAGTTEQRCSLSAATGCALQDLEACSAYNVSVTAEGSAGSSSPVSTLSQTRDAAPGPPRNLTAEAVRARNATVRWLPPARHARCVARYLLTWTGPAAASAAASAASAASTGRLIAGLQPGSRYELSLAAVSGGNLTSEPVHLVVLTTSEPQNTSEVVTAVVISLLLLGGIVICTIYTYRKGILVWPPWEKSGQRRKDVTHREISLKDFRSYCDQLLSAPARVQSEYQLLVSLCADLSATTPSTVGHLPDNKKKNRYINVIPFDATRVKLETSNKGMSDYINASYIKGYSGAVEYIATQGPKEETCEDFWNMVLQQHVQLIIMLTQFEENDKVKCFRYFPGLRGNVKFGDITVHCATEMMFPIYTQRTFIIYKDGRKKSVKHLHFREWPDFGCPDNTDVMLEFCQVGRQNTESRDCPTVVHCSAGVGRTGTYIAVDVLLQQIKENKKVDIFNTVYKLRQHRVNMVQSEAQYVYIYQCIRDALDDETIMHPDKSSSRASLEPIYENVENINLTTNSTSYEKLAKVSIACSDSESEL